MMTNGAQIMMSENNVFFTTIANWTPQRAATPTGVRREKAKKARKCCFFYNI